MAHASPARDGAPQPNHTAIWARALQRLRDTLSAEEYQTYFVDTHALEIRGGVLHIGQPLSIKLQTLKSTYHARIQAAVRYAAGKPMEIEYRVASRPEPTPIEQARQSSDNQLWGSQESRAERDNWQAGSGKTDRYFPVLGANATFERFIVGEANQIAHAAAIRVADEPGRDMNPLFIHAPTGQGKTHLLAAIAHRTLREYNVVYSDAERYVRGFVDSVRQGWRDQFQERYENAGILIIDDIQKIQSADGAQEEFFNLFNALVPSGRQIVIASDRPPRSLPGLLDRLVTRFESGFVTRIDSADPTLCLAILDRCAREEGIELDAATASVIAERANGTVRSLLGNWRTVRVRAELARVPITRAFAEQALDAHAPEPTPQKTVQFADILAAAAELSDVSPHVILGTGTKRLRTRQVTRPRHLVFFLAHIHLGMSFTEIAKQFGGMDHTSVMNGVRNVSAAVNGDADSAGDRWWRQSVAEIRARFNLVD